MLQRDRASLYNELLQDSYLTRNDSHLSGIITLGTEVEYRLAFRNNLHIASIKQFYKKNRLIGKSSDHNDKNTDDWKPHAQRRLTLKFFIQAFWQLIRNV